MQLLEDKSDVPYYGYDRRVELGDYMVECVGFLALILEKKCSSIQFFLTLYLYLPAWRIDVSPASADGSLAVGATDEGDNFATYSNYGSCVDVSAPGTSILSTYIGTCACKNIA